MIKLTTIVPVYDGQYIDECLNSMLKELHEKPELSKIFNIVVVSDGCDEDTLNKLVDYESRNECIKLVKSEHRGASHARNLGLMAATGEYVTFLDCDDRMCGNFFSDCKKYFESNADLYIFGIKRFEGDVIKYWQVEEKKYNSNSEFADEYIVNRHLLVYSNTNKLYKSSIIKEHNMLFDEAIEFGEDRLFNFKYLRYCNQIITSPIYKIDYVKRSEISLSTKPHKHYFDIAIKIHKEKIKCFLDLSKNVSEDDKKSFVAYDIGHEFEKAIARIEYNKEEEIESVAGMNHFIFENDDTIKEDLGVLIVLGSNNCGYRVEKALEIGKSKPYMKYLVSGGNAHKSGNITEADFMANVLSDLGISKENIYIEKNAKTTIENIIMSKDIIDKILSKEQTHRGIGIITAGFHIKRTKIVSRQVLSEKKYDLSFFSAYTERTSPDNWYKIEEGKNIILTELKKRVTYNFEDYLRFVYDNK